jgi:methylated-DNA-[protein]-cysteine S-methyltransferase
MGTQEFDEMPLDSNQDDSVLDELLHSAHRRFDPAFKRIQRPQVEIGMATTSLGELMVAQGGRGLMLVRYPETPGGSTLLSQLREQFDLIESRAIAEAVGDEIEHFLKGEIEAVDARPIDLSLVTSPFQRRALNQLRKVPAGAVTTYQALATASGSPSAQRAIGNTMASNPLPIYVPCHRVIKSDGSIGSYGGGVERKLKLLRAEGFEIAPGKRIPTGSVYGHLVTRIYCRPTCSAAKRARIDRMLIFPDIRKAASAGMRPCKVCRPD